MSSAPSGFNTPKTNWVSADAVTPTDMNRIEGNINAIETGSRTIDPTSAPSGLIGNLRQFLDWFANRIKAITGKTNWYDAPTLTLEALATHKSRHATGGADALTPADINAVDKAGDTMTGPLTIATIKGFTVTFRRSGYITWAITRGADTSLTILPSTSVDGEDWDWNKKITIDPAGNIYVQGSKVWHTGNDGAGSGLDADYFDGKDSSYFQPASDERLKTDIQPLVGALAKVLALRGVSYVWNDKAHEVGAARETMAGREIGLLAGEVAQVVPEVVLDWIQTPDGVRYKTVDSARLVALCIEAIKELNAQVTELKAKIEELQRVITI